MQLSTSSSGGCQDLVVSEVWPTLSRPAVRYGIAVLMGAALSIVSQVIAARVLDLRAFGVFAYVLGWIQLLRSVTPLGTDRALLTLSGGTGAAFDDDLAAATAVAVFGGILGAIGLGVLLTIQDDAALSSMFVALASCALVLQTATMTFAAVGRLRQRHVLSVVPLSITQPLVVGVVLVVWSAAGEVGPQEALAAITTSSVVALGAAVMISMPVPRTAAVSWRRAREAMRSSSAFASSALAQAVASRADLVIVGLLLGARDSAIYAPPLRIAFAMLIATNTVNLWVAPRVAVLHRDHRGADIVNVESRSRRAGLLLTAPLAVGVLIAPETALNAFGAEFTDGATALRLLAVGQIVAAWSGPAGMSLAMTGEQHTLAIVDTASAAALLLLCGAGAIIGGVNGVALGSAVQAAGRAIAVAMLRRRQIGQLLVRP